MFRLLTYHLDTRCQVADNHPDVLVSVVGLKHTGVCNERYKVVIASNAEQVKSRGQQCLSYFIA